MAFPRWKDKSGPTNLREVAPGLFVGALASPKAGRWAAVIDLYGSSSSAEMQPTYSRVPVVLRWQFNDGDRLPAGLLDTVEPLVRANLRKGPVLIHCQAGLSRSASTAYAMLRVLFGLPHEEAYRRIQIMADYPRPQTFASAASWVRRRLREDALS